MVAIRSNLLKNLSLGLGFVVAAAFLLFAASEPARAAGGGCYDASGQGTEVLVGGPPGVANSGAVHFDLPLAPALAEQACVEDVSAPPPGDGPFQVKGWAWDDNLGWISFYCSGGMNLGIPCGPIDYGVTMDGLAGPSPGRLSGYAWGDNVGWISFNCDNDGSCGTSNYYVEVETTQNACLGEIFSSSPPAGCVARPNHTTFAWSDNVGWIDFSGVKLPWVELISIAVDVDMEVVTSSGAVDLTAVDKLSAPVADGNDSYNLVLYMTKQFDGSPIVPADHDITVNLIWSDSVDTIQTDLSNTDHSGDNAGPTEKPLTFPGDFGAYAATIADAFVGDVTSIAPTSSMNGYDEGNDGTVDSLYERFVLGNPNDPSDVPTNDLILEDVEVSIVHLPSGICAFGGALCAPQSVAGPYLGHEVHFKPAVELVELSDQANDDSIYGQYTVPNFLDYQTARLDTSGQITSESIDFNQDIATDPFVFVMDTDNNGADCNDIQNFSIPSADIPWAPAGDTFQMIPVFGLLGGVGPGCEEEAEATGGDAYIYSVVEYSHGGTQVEYFSNKLPRVEGTLVVNPVAEIRGNVYSSGVTNPQTGQEVRSLGDVSTNILRNTIVRNVENLVAGVTEPTGTASITGWTAGTGFDITGQSANVLPDIAGVPRVYYFTDDVTISSDISWEGERTIIVEGGDLFIDGNLYNSPPALGAGLGIIVVEDLASGEGGNIYVHPDVTNIQANVFADGSVFSYSGNPGDINVGGEPVWTNEAQRLNVLENQLLIEGSVASQNTIGGAVKTPAILGDGTVIDPPVEGSYGSNPSGRSQARLYDLNFLRYYGLVFARHETGACIGDAIDQQRPTLCPSDPQYTILAEPVTSDPEGDLVPLSTTGADSAIGLDPNNDFAAVYVNFDPPSPSLPGFGVSSGVDIRIRN